MSAGHFSIIVATCALFATSALAADYEFVLDTGHPWGPNYLELGVETPIAISIRHNGNQTAPLRIGGIVFDFKNPEGGLFWDLDGPDDASSPTWFPPFEPCIELCIDCCPPPYGRNPNINDDGFRFEGILDGILHPNSGPGNFEDPNIPYFALHKPPQTALAGAAADAFRILRGETLQVATLLVTANVEGDQSLILGDPRGPSGLLVNSSFALVDIGDSANQWLHVIPEPSALWLLALGCMLLRRQ